jgi:hypothetical protein
MTFDRCFLPTECKSEREVHGNCGDITTCSYGLPPARFGSFSEKVVHLIYAPAVADATDGFLDLQRRPECTHAVQIIGRILITQPLE